MSRGPKIRPRARAAESKALDNTPRALAQPARQPAMSDDNTPPLPILARLPNVSVPPDRAALSLRLDWLKKLDWTQVRRVKLDPNWVAGGVLALVLFLLLMITLNRGAKPAASTLSENEAPSWSSTPSTAASPTARNASAAGTAIASPGAVTSMAANSPATTAITPNQAIVEPKRPQSDPALAQSRAAANSRASQISSETIYYPRTPYPTPEGISITAPTQSISGNASGPTNYGDGIRTAQRDNFTPHRAPAPTAQAQPRAAQFDGVITRP